MLETSQTTTTQPANIPPAQAGTPIQNPPVKQSISKPVVVFGVIGILVAFAIIGYTMLGKQEDIPIVQPPAQQIPKELTLSLDSPTDGALTVENELLVQGTTSGATVAIFTESDEVIVETEPSGTFETTVELSPGINTLVITAYGDEGEEKSVTLNVVYDDET